MDTLRSIAGFLKKPLSVLFVILIALLISFYIVGNAAYSTLTNPENYLNLFERTGFIERGRGLLADMVVSYSLGTTANTSFLRNYPLETWESVSKIILPTDWLKKNLDIVLNDGLAWLTSDQTQLPDMTIDLSPILQILRSSNGPLAILPLLQNVPVCPAGAQGYMVFNSGQMASCWPENQDITQLAKGIAVYIADTLNPEISMLQLQTVGLIDSNSLKMIMKTQGMVHTVSAALTFSFRLSLFFLCLYAILHSKSILHLLRSLPIPLYTGSAFSLALFSIWWAFLNWGLEPVIAISFAGLSVDVRSLLIDGIHSLNTPFWKSWITGTLAVLGLAILLQVMVFVLSKVEARKAVQGLPTKKELPRIRKQYR